MSLGKKVPATGNWSANLTIVGEGPGRDEEREGEPFVGTSGKDVDRLLRANGLDRSQVFLTNATKYRPRGSKDEFFFEGKKPSQVFMDGILELREELVTVSPNAVIALGDKAMWALTQKSGISHWRGSILESTLIPGLKVVPALHPAFFHRSRMFYQFPLLEWDFARGVRESRTPELNLPSADFVTSPTPDEIHYAIERFASAEELVVDTEWYSPENLAYIGFADSPDYSIIIPARSMLAYRAYKEILSSDVPKIIQNAAFDAVALARIGIDIRNIRDDLMIAFHNCWTDLRSKKLETICSILTRWPYYKDEGKFIGQDDERGQIYCGMDCVVEMKSMQAVRENEFAITGGKAGYDISMSAMDVFIEASKKGIRVDFEKLLELKKFYLERAELLEQTLSDAIGYSINCRSPKQVAELVYGRLGVKRKKKTTAQDVLMDIAASTDNQALRQLLKTIILVREDRNIVSRFINEGVVDRDGRGRTNWNLAGTRSGRFSTTKPWWNGSPHQTQPDEARVIYITDPGCVFVGWDLEQAEARVVAVKTYDHELLDDMNSGIDIHTKLASRLPFGLSYDELLELIEDKGKDSVRERYLAKKTRHGMNYKMGPGILKASINREFVKTDVGVSMRESKELHSSFLELHPGLPAWWKEVEATLREKKRLINTFGRVRNLLGILDDAVLREYVSFEPQSTVADLTTISIVEASKRMKGWGQCFLHMHDGGLFQVPEERKDEAIQIIREEMNREIRIDKEFITIPAEVKVGYSWGTLEKVD